MLKKPGWALGCGVLMAALFLAAGHLLGRLPVAGTFWGAPLVELLLAGVGALAMVAVGQGRRLLDLGRGFGEGVKAAGAMVGYLVLLMSAQVALWNAAPVDNGRALAFVAYMFIIGLAEELMFRGVIQNLLADAFGRDTGRGVWLSVIGSGLIFGLVHLSNVFAGVALTGALIQALVGAAAGMYLGAIYARCGNLWFLVLLHGFNDLVMLMAADGLDTAAVTAEISGYGLERLIGLAMYLALTAFILRPRKMAQITAQ